MEESSLLAAILTPFRSVKKLFNDSSGKAKVRKSQTRKTSLKRHQPSPASERGGRKRSKLKGRTRSTLKPARAFDSDTGKRRKSPPSHRFPRHHFTEPGEVPSGNDAESDAESNGSSVENSSENKSNLSDKNHEESTVEFRNKSKRSVRDYISFGDSNRHPKTRENVENIAADEKSVDDIWKSAKKYFKEKQKALVRSISSMNKRREKRLLLERRRSIRWSERQKQLSVQISATSPDIPIENDEPTFTNDEGLERIVDLTGTDAPVKEISQPTRRYRQQGRQRRNERDEDTLLQGKENPFNDETDDNHLERNEFEFENVEEKASESEGAEGDEVDREEAKHDSQPQPLGDQMNDGSVEPNSSDDESARVYHNSIHRDGVSDKGHEVNDDFPPQDRIFFTNNSLPPSEQLSNDESKMKELVRERRIGGVRFRNTNPPSLQKNGATQAKKTSIEFQSKNVDQNASGYAEDNDEDYEMRSHSEASLRTSSNQKVNENSRDNSSFSWKSLAGASSHGRAFQTMKTFFSSAKTSIANMRTKHAKRSKPKKVITSTRMIELDEGGESSASSSDDSETNSIARSIKFLEIEPSQRTKQQNENLGCTTTVPERRRYWQYDTDRLREAPRDRLHRVNSAPHTLSIYNSQDVKKAGTQSLQSSPQHYNSEGMRRASISPPSAHDEMIGRRISLLEIETDSGDGIIQSAQRFFSSAKRSISSMRRSRAQRIALQREKSKVKHLLRKKRRQQEDDINRLRRERRELLFEKALKEQRLLVSESEDEVLLNGREISKSRKSGGTNTIEKDALNASTTNRRFQLPHKLSFDRRGLETGNYDSASLSEETGSEEGVLQSIKSFFQKSKDKLSSALQSFRRRQAQRRQQQRVERRKRRKRKADEERLRLENERKKLELEKLRRKRRDLLWREPHLPDRNNNKQRKRIPSSHLSRRNMNDSTAGILTLNNLSTGSLRISPKYL